MRRSSVLTILMMFCLAGGAVCFLADLSGLMGQSAATWQPRLGAGLVLLAAVAGGTAMLLLRNDYRRLGRVISQSGDLLVRKIISAPSSDVSELAQAVNSLMASAEQAIADAHMRSKELEIQFKVATGQRQHAEAIIYSISDAVIVTDRFDEIVLANDSAARALDFELGNCQRESLDKTLHDPKLIEMVRDVRKGGDGGQRNARRVVEHTMKTSAGQRTFKVTLSCVTGQNDEPNGVVTVLHDMTREREIAQMKNDFVSSVSHELRTPLASIRAYVEMLIDGEAEDEKTKSEFYEVIQNEANRLGRLIDNILNISRIESGLVKIDRQPQSLAVITKDAIEVILPQARLKHIEVQEDLTPVYYQVLADRDMMYQAVLNLLSNAVKYTPEGGVIQVRTLVDESNKKVCTRISDNGVGIPPKDLPFVFDKFYRVEANSRMAKGTGLGLSLVKHIVETVHHGRIFVESQVGKGSTFGFELDLCE